MAIGFIQAFKGAISGDFADQWKDFYIVPSGISPTAGIFSAVKKSTDANRGANVKGSDNIITNGSKILVPDNMALLTFQSGELTGFICEPGGYIYSTDSVYASSFFSGGGIVQSIIKNSWERFKFGGIPADQQLAFYVNLKEIPNNRFGTQSEIYWDDAYLNAQVGALTRGSYTLKITDPIAFVKGYVPVRYIVQDAKPFDFADLNNPAVEQLFNEVIQSLSAAFSIYTNDPSKGNRITRIQSDSVGFAQSLSAAVEANYRWSTERGLTIITAALQAIEYDATSKALLADVQKADALMGARGNSFLQQSVARGVEAAGSNEGGAGGAIGIGMMGMGIGAAGGMASGLQQPVAPPPYGAPVYPQAAPTYPPQAPPAYAAPAQAPYAPPAPQYAPPANAQYAPPAPAYTPPAPQYAPQATPVAPVAPVAPPFEAPFASPVPAPAPVPFQAEVPVAPVAPVAAPVVSGAEDPYEKLTRLKGLLDAGVISQDDFDSAKKGLLGF